MFHFSPVSSVVLTHHLYVDHVPPLFSADVRAPKKAGFANDGSFMECVGRVLLALAHTSWCLFSPLPLALVCSRACAYPCPCSHRCCDGPTTVALCPISTHARSVPNTRVHRAHCRTFKRMQEEQQLKETADKARSKAKEGGKAQSETAASKRKPRGDRQPPGKRRKEDASSGDGDGAVRGAPSVVHTLPHSLSLSLLLPRSLRCFASVMC